jgi:GTP-binding protein
MEDHSRPSRDEKRERMRDRYAARALTQAELNAERRAGHWATAAEAGSGAAGQSGGETDPTSPQDSETS